MIAAHFMRHLGSVPQTDVQLTPRQIIKSPTKERVLTSTDFQEHIACLEAKLGRVPEHAAWLRDAAASGMRALQAEGVAAALAPEQIDALEALTIAIGSRPSLEMPDLAAHCRSNAGYYATLIRESDVNLEHLAHSVGIITRNGVQIGTGFVVGEGLVMTARHVAEVLAKADPRSTGDFTIQFRGSRDIAFRHCAPEGQSLPFCPDTVNFNQLDCAVLHLAEPGPAPLILSDNRTDGSKGVDVAVIGYPAAPPPGEERYSVLARLFDFTFGVQRLAWGEVLAAPGEPDNDTSGWVFSHDCTTLGGCSGAPVFDLTVPDFPVIGIHFGGARRVANFAHSAAGIRPVFDELNLNYG